MVVVPYTEIAPGVWEALELTGQDCEGVFVGDSDESYWRLLNKLWQKGETFCIVEHDVIVEPGTLDELLTCSDPWCSVRIEYLEKDEGYAGLGCTKFSEEIIHSNPDAVAKVGYMSDPTHPPKHWCRLDGWLQHVLYQAGSHLHIHDGLLTHVRPDHQSPWPSHGCIKRSSE